MANPRMTAEIGRVLGGRYRLVAPIGMGASAQVYLADDVKLRRRVAVKMLHDALAGDAEFLRRFRAEARSAAALSHPNVMAVYDWGDAEVAFIVTEYLPGGSLRALLDAGNLLTPAQALGVGLEAARALDYAHRRGFVHRDIKPANLLFGEEQRLRIADFGLARALAEAAWTEPQGAVLGTARYASPEQAKGEKLSGKADVYSLALVLVEAVSGEVPFVADTTLGTLMARVDRPLVVPDALGPLQGVLARAGHPDPEDRLDARGLATGLLRAAKVLRRPAPLPLAGALSPLGDVAIDADPTIHAGTHQPVDAGTVALTAAEAEASAMTDDDLELGPPDWVNQSAALAGAMAAMSAGSGKADEADRDEPDGAAGGDAPVDGSDEATETGMTSPGGPEDGAEAVDPDVEEPEADALVDLAEHEADAHGDTAIGGPAAVPVVDALDLTEAAVASPAWADGPALEPAGGDRALQPAGARTGVLERTAPAVIPPPAALTMPDRDEPYVLDDDQGARHRRRWPWVVLAVILLAGAGGAAAALATRDKGATAAPITLPVPTVSGRAEAQATAILEAAGWEVKVLHTRKDGTRKGQVLASEPAAGDRWREGRTVTITVSDGQTIVAVPDGLVGKTKDEAVALLATVGLKGEVQGTSYDEEAAKGLVLKLSDGTSPKLEKGATVGLILSDGPKPRTVPSGLQGSTVEEAKAALEAVQLKVAVVRSFSDSVAEGKIISVVPAVGSTVERGSVVTVEVSRGPELVAVPSIKGADTLAEAIAILRAKGFQPGSVSGPADGKPKSTNPAAGTMAKKGSEVDIVLGKGGN